MGWAARRFVSICNSYSAKPGSICYRSRQTEAFRRKISICNNYRPKTTLDVTNRDEQARSDQTSQSVTSRPTFAPLLLQIEILFERLETRSPSGKADRPTASPRRHTEDRATAARAWANPAIPDISSLFRTFLARFRTLSANVRKRDRHVRDGIWPTAAPSKGSQPHSRVP